MSVADQTTSSLPQILDRLTREQRTCVVRVRAREREGELCLERGEVLFVQFGAARGASAMLALVNEKELTFDVAAADEQPEPSSPPSEPSTATYPIVPSREELEAARDSQIELKSAPAQHDAPAVHHQDELEEETTLTSLSSAVRRELTPKARLEILPEASEPTHRATEAAHAGANLTDPDEQPQGLIEYEAHIFAEHVQMLPDDASVVAPMPFAATQPESEPAPRIAEATSSDSESAAPEAPQAVVTESAVSVAAPTAPTVEEAARRAADVVAARDEKTRTTQAGLPIGRPHATTDIRLPAPPSTSSERPDLPQRTPTLQPQRTSIALSDIPSLQVFDKPRTARPPTLPSKRRTLDGEPSMGEWIQQTFNAPGPATPPPLRPSVEFMPSIPPPPPEHKLPWIFMALCVALPVLVMAMFWSPRAESRERKETAAPANAPITPPSVLEGRPPVASAGTLLPTVLVRVVVDPNGRVRTADVQGSRAGLGDFEQKAVDAVRRYQFRPAMQGDTAVAGELTIPVRFAPAPVIRELVIKGSDTIGSELGPAWARAFEAKQQSGVRVKVEGLGSSTGFAALFDGSAQIAAASRAIRADEIAMAEKLGVRLREVVAGFDGVAVIVNRNNRVRTLDFAKLAGVYAQHAKRWSEIGGRDAAIRVLGRPTYSGTHTFFAEKVLGDAKDKAAFGANVQTIESSKQIVAEVAKDVDAIGYVSLGHVDASVQVVAIARDAGGNAVTPSPASIRDGSYPLARPLMLYVRADVNRDARAYVDFALSSEGQKLVEKEGFVSVGGTPVRPMLDESDGAPLSRVHISRIYFEEGSAALSKQASDELGIAALALRSAQQALIIGNADAGGDPKAKSALLARQRAAAVATLLKKSAPEKLALETSVAGIDHPLASNATEQGRQVNRRVDVVIVSR